MALVDWGAAVLGAFISGLVGLGVVEYQTLRAEYEERRQWYDRTIRLAERVEQAVPREREEVEDGSHHREYSMEFVDPELHEEIELGHTIFTHWLISSDLNEHIGTSPIGVESELLEQAEELAALLRFTSERNIHLEDEVQVYSWAGSADRPDPSILLMASEYGTELKRMAEAERDNVGWLWL